MRKITSEFNKKSNGDLDKEIISLRVEIAKTSLEQGTNPAKDTNLISKKKKRLSQLLTIAGIKKRGLKS